MINVYNTTFPFNKNKFSVELYEMGNAPDYSFVYTIGVQAARGATESYPLDNCPKFDPNNYIQITGKNGSDIMKYDYIGIDFGTVGDGKKWYFVTGKTILNYPTIVNGAQLGYAVQYDLALDVWETYKNQLNSPKIKLDQVTTNSPSSFNDVSMIEQDVLPFSSEKIVSTSPKYSNWKTIVGWQSNKPTDQDNFVIDGMRTTLQFNETGDTTDYLTGLDDLATGTLEETQIWRSYITCNTYVVSEYFATENGTSSEEEILQLANPSTTQIHKRLDYYPYKRAFLTTLDGQQIEFDYKKYFSDKLPENLVVNVTHSTLPSPTTTLAIDYPGLSMTDVIVFNAYPSMDFVGKNITPVTQLTDLFNDQMNTVGKIGGMSNFPII